MHSSRTKAGVADFLYTPNAIPSMFFFLGCSRLATGGLWVSFATVKGFMCARRGSEGDGLGLV